jgi:hypothetical protein
MSTTAKTAINPEELERVRTVVRQRLSQRNWIGLIAMLWAAPIPLIAAWRCHPFPGWTVLVALLAAPAAMMIWELTAGRKSRICCPVCGEDWQHDDFLKWPQCEQCGLRLSAGVSRSSAAHGDRCEGDKI